MFDRIAERYDSVNTIMTGGVDVLWRARAVAQLRAPVGARVLDLCCGTGALSRAVAARLAGCDVVGVDFSSAMLAVARRRNGVSNVSFAEADALALPFADETFDGATMGFSMRNVVDIGMCLREAARVLKPGARFVNLEVSRPPNALWRRMFFAYFFHIVPIIGKVVGGDAAAYRYLPQSLVGFPSVSALADLFCANGFAKVSCVPLNGGIATLHVGTKVGGDGRSAATASVSRA